MMIYKSELFYISVFIFACISSTYAEGEPEPQTQQQSSDDELREKSKNKPTDAQVTPVVTPDDVRPHNPPTNKSTILSCIANRPDINLSVEIVNGTRLSQVLQLEQNVTNRAVPGTCAAVLFYSPSCPFSSLAAPHFNALPRLFPNVKMVAVDAMHHRNFNTQYGIIGTPTLVLFHSGRPVFKFNETSEYRLEAFANFITKHTGIKPAGKLEVTTADYEGPLSAVPVKETDYYLTLSWLVIAARVLYSLFYSTWGRSLADATLNAWREAEAQHHHAE